MYFVGLPEREKMAYATRVEALRRRFGQETDTSIALQELAGLRRGKNQSAKELADSARRLASRAYHSNDYTSQEKAALHAFQTAVGEDLQLKCAERSCRTLEMEVETVEIQERYTKKAVRALKQEESDMALQLRTMGEKLETLIGEIKNDREQRKEWVTEVRTITEETLAVRAVGPATLAPHAITQVRVIVPTPRACGTVMVDRGPGPLGLCPVRGIVEVEQASNIWLANPGSQPIQLDGDEVVALAECVLAGPGASAGSDRDIGDEVNGLVEPRTLPVRSAGSCRWPWRLANMHLFAKGKGDLGRTDIIQHRIHTGDQPAIKQRVRRYPAARREEERQLVEDMLAIGIIQESNSAWSSPTVLVKKKDGTTRFCINYRRLNQATKVDAYPLPHIEDSLNTLGGARFFCSLDLASGYWQVEMDAADREKTAFVTQGGLYEFRVMPFGLVNAPATFERLMERVLRGISWSECLVYLDDILVFGPDFGTKLARLEKVLDRLGEAGLKLKAKKCQLFQEEIPFLGHIVSAAGIGADPTKCQQVRDWPVPRDLHEVRSFVGLCSYYRRHIQGFTELAAPLYELVTKGTEFEWTDRRHEAFGQLKNALTSAPILGFPREDGLWYLATWGWELCCLRSRTRKSESLPMSASHSRGANRGIARPARSCWP